MESDELSLKKLKNSLCEKYKYVVGNTSQNLMSVEKIVERIVNYYEKIIYHMPGNIYWLDRNLKGIGCNKNVLDMFGLNFISQFKGLTFEKMKEMANWSMESMLSFKSDTLEVIQTGQAKINVEEPPIPDVNGKIFYFLTNRVPLYDEDNKIIAVIGVSIDITELKEAQMALFRAKEDAEEAVRVKTEFMNNMSHDFKTPLNGIFGALQILEKMPQTDDAKELLEMQKKSILRLNKMVMAILDFNRLYSGKLEIQHEELNLLEAIENIVGNVSYQLKTKKIHIDIHYPPTLPSALLGDSHAVTSILLNLIDNAVKFTEKGEVRIGVEILSQAKENAIFRITLQDTGIGIPADQLCAIFERFRRLEPSNKGLKEGHGIGLAVVKELVEKLNGKISVKSELGVGSTFTVDLPFEIQEVTLASIAQWQQHYPDLRILWVSDRKTPDVVAEQLGKEAVNRVDSRETINALLSATQENQPYHILIVDENIEMVAPIPFIKIICCVKGIGKIMPLLNCHMHNKEGLDEARKAGYFDFIINPILPRELNLKMTQTWERWQKL